MLYSRTLFLFFFLVFLLASGTKEQTQLPLARLNTHFSGGLTAADRGGSCIQQADVRTGSADRGTCNIHGQHTTNVECRREGLVKIQSQNAGVQDLKFQPCTLSHHIPPLSQMIPAD